MSDAHIEQAAKALWEHRTNEPWESMPEWIREDYRIQVRAFAKEIGRVFYQVPYQRQEMAG